MGGEREELEVMERLVESKKRKSVNRQEARKKQSLPPRSTPLSTRALSLPRTLIHMGIPDAAGQAPIY